VGDFKNHSWRTRGFATALGILIFILCPTREFFL
jgi:hypothetical protein